MHLLETRTLQNKTAETIFSILESKNVSIASIGNSVFGEIDKVKYKHIFYILWKYKFYSKSLKHTSFSTWFVSSRIQICCVKIIIVTSGKNGSSFASRYFGTFAGSEGQKIFSKHVYFIW